jgi:uncharacterized protein YvpB
MPSNAMPRPFRGVYILASRQSAPKPELAASAADRVSLAVPHFHQERSLSCEMASLRMAAQYHKVSVTETQLVQLLPVSLAQPRIEGARVVWTDANRLFAGNIRGWQLYYGGLRAYPQRARRGAWGYGIHAPGIAEVTLHLGLQAEVFDEVGGVYAALDRGSVPIVIVPCRGRARSRQWTWYTPNGDPVSVIDSEHAIAVTGYNGQYVWVNDPLSQVSRYDRASFEVAFSLLRSGVVVAPARTQVPPPARHARDNYRLVPRLR